MIIENAKIIREKRKTLKITIQPTGELIVYSPMKLAYSRIYQILEQKERLLEKKYNKIKSTTLKYSEIMQFKKVMLLGKEYFIVPTQKVGKAYFTDDTFLIPMKCYEQDKSAFFIKKVFKKIAENIFSARVPKLAQRLPSKYSYSKISVGSFKSKWGSCDSLGTLKFNWKLIMAPSETIDFVIYHELTHLIELNHSQNFYKILQALCPTWKEKRENLKELNFLLSLYD